MKPESGDSAEEPGKELGSAQREARTCPVCGTKYFATTDMEFCPVCVLLGATGGESAATGEPGSVSELAAAEADGGSQGRRFEHYEVMLDEDGRPIELGHGAMGITYKALDVDLRCPVTLKVISERYLGDESARLRFCARPGRRQRCATRMLPRSSTWAEPEAVTSTRWSSWREKPLSISSDARDGSK